MEDKVVSTAMSHFKNLPTYLEAGFEDSSLNACYAWDHGVPVSDSLYILVVPKFIYHKHGFHAEYSSKSPKCDAPLIISLSLCRRWDFAQ